MTEKTCWIPPLYPFPEESFDYKSYLIYEKKLYDIYKSNFLDSYPVFENKKVQVRFYPKIENYEESFIHLTCKNFDGHNYKDRMPDFDRCERISWIRPCIENYRCKETCLENCDGVKYWEETYKNTKRVYLLLEEERYVVILEKRKDYNLLITAYYIEYNHSLEKLLKKYDKFKKAEGAFQ